MSYTMRTFITKFLAVSHLCQLAQAGDLELRGAKAYEEVRTLGEDDYITTGTTTAASGVMPEEQEELRDRTSSLGRELETKPKIDFAGGEFDCEAGFKEWKLGWSGPKKAWCCKKAGKGCPFECDAGLENFEEGWTKPKKEWCCANQQKGCPEGPPYLLIAAAILSVLLCCLLLCLCMRRKRPKSEETKALIAQPKLEQIMFDTVRFEEQRDDLLPEENGSLAQVVATLKNYNVPLKIEVTCVDQALAYRRAENVRKTLKENGITQDIDIVGYGCETESGRQVKILPR